MTRVSDWLVHHHQSTPLGESLHGAASLIAERERLILSFTKNVNAIVRVPHIAVLHSWQDRITILFSFSLIWPFLQKISKN